MPLLFIVLSICLVAVYGVLFLRPRYRILAGAVASAALFFVYWAVVQLGVPNEGVARLSLVMMALTGLMALALLVGHLIFERRRPGGPAAGGEPPRELAP